MVPMIGRIWHSQPCCVNPLNAGADGAGSHREERRLELRYVTHCSPLIACRVPVLATLLLAAEQEAARCSRHCVVQVLFLPRPSGVILWELCSGEQSYGSLVLSAALPSCRFPTREVWPVHPATCQASATALRFVTQASAHAAASSPPCTCRSTAPLRWQRYR